MAEGGGQAKRFAGCKKQGNEEDHQQKAVQCGSTLEIPATGVGMFMYGMTRSCHFSSTISPATQRF